MKVKGEGNLADALTKPLVGPGVTKHLQPTGQEVKRGRHELTPDFETVDKPDELISEDAVAGEVEGLKCFYTPWGYTNTGAAYQNACTSFPLFGLVELISRAGTMTSEHKSTSSVEGSDDEQLMFNRMQLLLPLPVSTMRVHSA